jgi:hypothetical protein
MLDAPRTTGIRSTRGVRSKRTRAARYLAAAAALAACRSGGGSGGGGAPPDPVLSAVLLPGQRITFARPGPNGYEVLPSASFILRLTVRGTSRRSSTTSGTP